MSAHDRITEVLDGHGRNPWGQHVGWWECLCGEPLTSAHLADVLLSTNGIAVIELPESDGEDDDGQEYFGDFGIRVDHTGRGTEYPRIYIDGRPSTPEAARREAAALLAAAQAAESGETP